MTSHLYLKLVPKQHEIEHLQMRLSFGNTVRSFISVKYDVLRCCSHNMLFNLKETTGISRIAN